MIPDNITREHLEKAIQEIDEKGIRKGRQSSTYDLVYEGKKYPPKLVISIANRFANGVELDHSTFSGGMGTAAVKLLEKENFIVSPKKDPIKALIEKYKKHIEQTNLKDERYKWELVTEFKGRPDTSVADFGEEVKGVKFKNLVYAMGIAVLNHLAKSKPDELRVLFEYLFDENIDLINRVKFFNTESLKLYRSLGETLSHHQDERSIATYLTFHNSQKYTFYKSSFYKKYCKLLGVPIAKKNEKYVHYLELIDQLIEEYINPDKDLISKVRNLIPDLYDGSDHKLLAQDILYQMLDKKGVDNYWIFQGNPKIYNVVDALNNEELSSWRVNAHESKIRENDKIILWMSGQNSGCYAIGEVVSKVYEGIDEEKELKYYINGENNSTAKRVKINITHNLASNPITKEQIRLVPELANLKIGNQGTNFSSTEDEYNAILELLENNQSEKIETINPNATMTPQNMILYGPPGTGKTYSTIDKALEIIHGANYLVGKNRTDLQAEFNSLKEKGQIQFTTFHQSFSYEDFVEGIRPIPPGKGDNESDQLIYDVESGIFKSLCEFAMGGDIESHSEVSVEVSKARYYKMSLGGRQNQELHDWCVENNYVALGYGGNNDYSELKDKRDWNSFKTYFNENYPELVAKSRFHIQAVYAFLGMKTGDIVLATLGNHIVDAIGVIDGDYEWSDDKAIDYSQFRKVKWLATNLKAKPEKFVRKKISQQTIYEFYNADIKKEAFENLLSQESEEEQNYVLIIDEINRGNVASIFGELITLLEPDKRLGAENELTVSLPYSRDSFGVPSNLHVIGTMNTADRSVEALDTALRRRFSFIEMMCDYTVLDKVIGYDFEVNGIVIKQMLKTINERLELLLNRDHQIGHAWFLSLKNAKDKQKELDNIFQNKIIPLLQEFFYADYGKIGLVLGNGFVEVKVEKNGHKPFANFDYENDAFEEQKLYKIRQKIKWDIVREEFGTKETKTEEKKIEVKEKEFENA